MSDRGQQSNSEEQGHCYLRQRKPRDDWAGAVGIPGRRVDENDKGTGSEDELWHSMDQAAMGQVVLAGALCGRRGMILETVMGETRWY